MNSKNISKSSEASKIKKQLKDLSPMLQEHGGDVEFIDFDEKTGTVTVRLLGMCSGCPMAGETLKYGIEELLKEKIKEVKQVISI